MPHIRCPSCKAVFAAAEASRGTVAPCASCGRPCRIPARAANPQPQAQAITRSPNSPRPAPEEDVLEEVAAADDAVQADRPPRRPGREDVAEAPDDAVQVPMEGVRRCRRKKRRGYRLDGNLERVNLGLGFYYASILTLLGGLVVELAAFAAALAGVGNAVAGQGGGAAAGLGVALILGFLASALINWIAPILGLVGSILCLWAPSVSGARGLCIASLTLNATAFLGGLLSQVLAFLGPRGATLAVLGLLPAALMTFIAWCLFMAFLRQLCKHLGEDSLAEEAIAVMIRGIVILVAAPFCFVLAVLLMMVGCVGIITFVLAVGFSLYGLFRFLRRQLDLIGSIRQIIASRF